MNSRKFSRRDFLKLSSLPVLGSPFLFTPTARGQFLELGATPFESDWHNLPDRLWIGPTYWANPMEDWRIQEGRLVCSSRGGNRNVHALTHQLAPVAGDFDISVHAGMLEDGPNGSVGFRVGIHDSINDYRGNCFFGQGVNAVLKTDGTLVLANNTLKVDAPLPLEAFQLRLTGHAEGAQYRLQFQLLDASGKAIREITAMVDAERLVGNIALVNNHLAQPNGARFWFDQWRLSGDKIERHPERTFGPILWAMHTLSNNRDEDGHVMKMTAQMPPMGEQDSKQVYLEIKEEGSWARIAEAPINPQSRTATFRIAQWQADKSIPYRLVYETQTLDGRTLHDEWSGIVQKDPVDRPLKVGGLTCQYYAGFPYAPLVDNLGALEPDLLYFSGDQIYEANGGYGVVREPSDRAMVNYLRKWYLFGWAFGDLMRDRPTLCLPDDHDVFHGNLWGEGGRPLTGGDTSTNAGYIQPLEMVNAVHETQTSHHPDLFDPSLTEHGMQVMYGDMVYGRVSFGIVNDRQFKSGPYHVDTGDGRADHLMDPSIDVASLDKPGLEMLGERQEAFLRHWAEDWRGADMKVLLSGTTFANAATHHGQEDNFLLADIDSGGWPQSARNRALKLARSARAFHLSGDQHLATLIKHGIEEQRDAIWGFCTPAISVIYQRWWRPDEMGYPHDKRPEHGLPNTGEFLDGLGNKIYVYAVANPSAEEVPHRYEQQQLKAAGFGFCEIDTTARRIDIHCYKFLTDVQDSSEESQYPGWPHTIYQDESDGRSPIGRLPEIRFADVENPVLKVYDADEQLVYAERLQDNVVRPEVYEDGVYTVMLGDPETDSWEIRREQQVE